VQFECSGAEIALAQGIGVMRPRGVVMQLGMGGDLRIPMQQVTTKELDLRGSFRFHEEFPLAVELMQAGLVDLKPLITHTVPLDDAVKAFDTANDRSRAVKVQIAFA
jgi:L-idonate 5-dehydrogenase